MNNYNNFLCLGILVFTSLLIVTGIHSKVFVINLPYINYNGSNLYISPTDNAVSISWAPNYTPVAEALSDTNRTLNTEAIVWY